MGSVVTERQGVHPAVRRLVRVLGIVQGVGFRPFIHRLARRHDLAGSVLNYAGGVDIEIEGPSHALDAFVQDLRADKPPIALIESVTTQELATTGEAGFRILPSRDGDQGSILVSPDVAVCPDCDAELTDPADRRFRHPFINCTNCGPRYTIIRSMPYDRPNTSMGRFPMCERCRAEYGDIDDRRFHAQPVACPDCGPNLYYATAGIGERESVEGEQAVAAAVEALRAGKIVAVKGLGGFHLACDATNEAAVRLLRERKGREEKPLALMAPSLEVIRAFCVVPEDAVELLQGAQRPICLLPKRPDAPVAPSVAPDSACFGVMLPYAPVQRLLLEDGGFAALVMTSGNLSDEPLATDNDEAFHRLGHIADAFLYHDRDILVGCDDSVARPAPTGLILMRRARGYAPFPVRLPGCQPSVLALGAHLKNTVCLTKGDYAFSSQHLGDLDDAETLRFMERIVEHLASILRVEPEALACDLHPDYLSTRHAEALAAERGLPLVRVQHHHAHIVSAAAECGVTEPVLGVACDGTGLGEDGTVWGCEVLVADPQTYSRAAHLAYVPLPGGDRAVREPWRMAAVYLDRAFGPDFADALDLEFCRALDRNAWALLRALVEHELNAPPASSAGRLFDAVAALTGVQQVCSYEGQAAMRLEACAVVTDRVYPFEVREDDGLLVMEPGPMFRSIADDLRTRRSVGEISGAFHNTFVAMLATVVERLAEETGLRRVALSGGAFQNARVLTGLCRRLSAAGLEPLLHRQIPCNDGGLAFGQAVIAGAQLR
ncbi:MAG: carbamoyltransferase HypF [Armatimonadetes bacterium]|nr:carbamoyltransferase HypF [Armatimonadota bacterium]